MRDLCRERSTEWSAGVAILLRKKDGRGREDANLSLRASRSEACTPGQEMWPSRIVMAIVGDGSFMTMAPGNYE